MFPTLEITKFLMIVFSCHTHENGYPGSMPKSLFTSDVHISGSLIFVLIGLEGTYKSKQKFKTLINSHPSLLALPPRNR
jgi:hypothetical protein